MNKVRRIAKPYLDKCHSHYYCNSLQRQGTVIGEYAKGSYQITERALFSCIKVYVSWRTHHSDGECVIKLFGTDTDKGRHQEQHNERVVELEEGDKQVWTLNGAHQNHRLIMSLTTVTYLIDVFSPQWIVFLDLKLVEAMHLSPLLHLFRGESFGAVRTKPMHNIRDSGDGRL